MIAKTEITTGIPNRGRFKKENHPGKLTRRPIVSLPKYRHTAEGNVPEKWTQAKGTESPKVDRSKRDKNDKVGSWASLKQGHLIQFKKHVWQTITRKINLCQANRAKPISF